MMRPSSSLGSSMYDVIDHHHLCTMRTLGGSPGRDGGAAAAAAVGHEQAFYEVGIEV